MNWEFLIDYIDPKLMGLSAFLYVVGAFLKLNDKLKGAWKIPYILWGISVVITILYSGFVLENGFGPQCVIIGIIEGTFLAALAVFANQLYKQAVNK